VVRGRRSGFDDDVCLVPFAVKFLVGNFLFNPVSGTLCLHPVALDSDKQVDVTRSIGASACDATKEDDADIVPNSLLKSAENRSNWCVVRCLWNSCDWVIGLDEHRWVNLHCVRTTGPVDGNHAQRLERIDGGIHATQSVSRYPVELSVRETPVWIVGQDVEDISGCPVSERIRFSQRNRKPNVCSRCRHLSLNHLIVHDCYNGSKSQKPWCRRERVFGSKSPHTEYVCPREDCCDTYFARPPS
jgi:hypothetical protein